MRYIPLLLLIILFGCKEIDEFCDENNHEICEDKEVTLTNNFVQVFPNIEHRPDYNGIFNEIADDTWQYKSHMVPNPYPETPGVYCHYCKKVQTHYFDDKAHTPGREVKYSFILRIDKYNFIDPPKRVIVFQQWQPRTKEDHILHPVTTLKLTRWKGLSIGLFNDAWQYDYTEANPYNIDDPMDKKHRHPFSENSGFKKLSVGRNYYIELILSDGKTLKDGKTTLIINNVVIATSYHQIRSRVNPATIAWGLYWSGGFKNGYNGGLPNKCSKATGEPDLVCKSIQTTVMNFKIYEKL